MHRTSRPFVRALLLGLTVTCLHAQTPPDYVRDVEPILQKRCTACHGAGQQLAGLRLDDADGLKKGSGAGPVVLAGKAADSKLYQRITSTKKGHMMPPIGEPLSAAEIEKIRSWIEAGARFPAATVQAKATNPRSKHWAFQPISRPATPAVKQASWSRNPIDAFVLARLESEGIAPSPEASKRTLLRRLSIDLTGLPPTPAELAEFEADSSSSAYERAVDRLLASPHYGEKWARHWLDLARYADSDGYEKDLVRPYAWRYRNWVIDAFNRDMPFDQFTIEQLAGDLLPGATVEQKVATGFHRQVLTNREAGVDREEARFEQNINRANTIGTTWLGLSVGCAQCHNHKYDPISQKEFYQLFAFVDRLEERDIDAPLPGEMGPFLKARPEFDRARKHLLGQHNVAELQAAWEKRLKQAVEKPGENLEWDFEVTAYKASVDNALKLLYKPEAQRTNFESETMTFYFLRNSGPDYKRQGHIITCLQDARADLQDLMSKFTPLTMAYVVTEDPSVKTHIAIGGDHKVKGDAVEPGTLAVLPPLLGQPSRLTLAKWIVSRENPLTARVIANRIWQEFFGRGLVRTSEDFGTQGDRPSHPELLDWLATEFMERGWSVKQLHKTIVMSAAYRQSSKARKDLETKDPENILLARQTRLRLPAELLRDSALSVSGLLNPRIGGPSIRPPQPAGVAELGYANNVKWVETTGPERFRRGLYVHFQRTTPHPQLMNFDAPNSTVACSRRARSNTPLQALNLLNDPVFVEAAQGLAMRLLTEPRDPQTSITSRIDWAFETALGRKPSEKERSRLAQYLDQQLTLVKQNPQEASALMPIAPEGVKQDEAAAWAGLCRVLLNLDEFITRE
jgi:mono/diheme cytochrome c family protein